MKNILRIASVFALLASTGAIKAETAAQKAEKAAKARKTAQHNAEVKAKAHHKAAAKTKYTSSPHNKAKKASASKAEYKSSPHKSAAEKSKATAYSHKPVTPKKTTGGSTSYLSELLGTAAASKTATASSLHNPDHKHYGPRDWHDSFPSHWKHGFEWGKHNGQHVFAGHPITWWQTHYPTYYKDVIHPEYKNITHSK